jgi:hypothetical protein
MTDNSQEKKNDQTLALTIQTPKGVLENEKFPKTLKVSELIQKVVAHFSFATDGNYRLKVKGAADFMDPQRPLVSYQLNDGDVLSFTDLGKGA